MVPLSTSDSVFPKIALLGTTDKIFKVPSAGDQKMPKISSFKPGVDQVTALHALLAARNSA